MIDYLTAYHLGITASASELNYVDVVAGTAAVSKALVLNGTGDISGINSLSATSLTGTIQSAAQPNITSVGTFSSLTVSGSINQWINLDISIEYYWYATDSSSAQYYLSWILVFT
ncbi:hypothetical protein F443_11869 [Phytophthora nicotianae P1569]|uniref:Uncharacterized protein n=1 Tax=Phytophthora nicotianae P1569 TaxID=1317065 RepID=V9EV16_PHYNI|nr:hypothetical protein F443_11869 [Phytophthora nicotianae P1569]